MSFLDCLKTEANYTKTLNGAKTHGSSGNDCLDFFAVAGGMRYRKKEEQIRLFTRAYIENPELAMKLLFHIRDIREGMGERELFRTLIRYVAKTWPESARKNVHLIAKFGRFDDLMCLMGTSLENEVVKVIKEQLEKDLQAVSRRNLGDIDAKVSLLPKWMPSINTSSARTRGKAKVLAKALGMNEMEYRKMLSKLRAHSHITEVQMTKGAFHKINYESVPAGALYKYRGVFERRDKKNFNDYLVAVNKGDKKIHCDSLYPYEIMRPYFKNIHLDFLGIDMAEPEGRFLLETMWKHLSAEVEQENAISVIDVSGSMYCAKKGAPMPALISQALGIYYAEHCSGVFHNHVITFSSKPSLVEIKGETLFDQLKYLSTVPWGMNTNMQAVFELILQTAINHRISQDEMPSVIYIFSDMEFDMAVNDPNKTVYDEAKELYEAYGYQLPAVVFHNVNSWQMQVPVKAHTKGTALVSGAGTSNFKYKFDGNVTPMSHMLRVLNSDRYKEVHA